MSEEMEGANAINNEINALRGDKITSEREVTTLKNKVAESLLNGLGEDIRKTLNEPVEEIKESAIKRFFKKLINICN